MCRPLAEFEAAARARVDLVLTDLDGTLTTDGRLPAVAYAALERLARSGIGVVPVTGGPAGWCDMIARLWPVLGVVGEGGGLYYRYDRAGRRMLRRYWKPAGERARDRDRLRALGREIVAQVPGTAISADHDFRLTDLAVDIGADVAPLDAASIGRVIALFEKAGATAKLSSIHVNGWFGPYDKLAMARLFAAEVLGRDLDGARDTTVYVGDAPNDQPMFAFFPRSVGVANVRRFLGTLAPPPAFVTPSAGGEGFAELAEALIAARAVPPP